MLRLFLHSFETSPAAMLGAFEPLHLPSAMRHSTLVSLQSAVKVRSCMAGNIKRGWLSTAPFQLSNCSMREYSSFLPSAS